MPDLLVSVIVFTAVLTTGFFAVKQQNDKSFQFSEEQFLREKVGRIADLMVRTGGHPAEWNNTTVKVIGFAPGDDHILQNTTIHQLNSTDSRLSYTAALDVTGLRAYNMLLNISTENYDFTYGQPFPADADLVISQTRSVLVNTSTFLERGTLVLEVWQQ